MPVSVRFALMALVTFAGPPARVGVITQALREAGFSASVDEGLPQERRSGGATDLIVAVITVVGSTAGTVAAELLRPLIDQLCDREPPVCVLLAVSDRQARRIRWHHNGDECVAEVGKPLKWRSFYRKSGQPMPWKYGRTVWLIEPERPCWSVTLDVSQPPDRWTNPILCGDQVEVDWYEAGSPPP
jgi:hypothetical protein